MTSALTGADGQRPLGPDEFRDVIGHFASGVTVITTLLDGERFGTTASAVSSLSLEPPMLLVCMNKQSSTGTAIAATRRFAVNILGENQADAAVRFAGKGADKFAGVPVTAGVYGDPLLDEAVATVECRVVEDVTGGTHTVFLAEVDRASATGGAPLAYFRGQFGRLELAHDETAFRDLRARIVSRDIPIGEPLDLDKIARMTGIARGPLYHALAKLTADGLVSRTPDGSFKVAPVTIDAAADALRARAAIEIGVAAMRVGTLDAAELAECRRLAASISPVGAGGEPRSFEEWMTARSEFLDHMVGLAGSETLLDSYRRINVAAIITCLRSMTGRQTDVPAADARHDHAALLDAYEQGDLAAASTAILRRTASVIDAVRREIAAAGGEI